MIISRKNPIPTISELDIRIQHGSDSDSPAVCLVDLRLNTDDLSEGGLYFDIIITRAFLGISTQGYEIVPGSRLNEPTRTQSTKKTRSTAHSEKTMHRNTASVKAGGAARLGLGSGLIHTQKAMIAARQTAERKLTASLS